MTVDVVMPVYNAARHLRAALDSLRAQTFEDWTCTCVDDGSTDDSPGILAAAAAEDPRIRVLRQANAGPAAARNAGLDASDGPWAFFMDADDVLPPHALTALAAAATRTDADVCWGQHASFDGEFPEPPADEAVRVFADAELRAFVDGRFSQEKGGANPWYGVPVMAWNKLIRRAALGDLRFCADRGIVGGEDVLFCAELFRRVARAAVVSETTYGYRRVEGSLFHQRTTAWLARYAEAYARVGECMADRPDFVRNFVRAAVRPGFVRQALDAFVVTGRVRDDAEAAEVFRRAFARLRDAFRGASGLKLDAWLALGAGGWWRTLRALYLHSALWRKSRSWEE